MKFRRYQTLCGIQLNPAGVKLSSRQFFQTAAMYMRKKLTEQQILETLDFYPKLIKHIESVGRKVLQIRGVNAQLTYEDFDYENSNISVTFKEYIHAYEFEHATFPVEYLWTDFEEVERSRFEAAQKRLKEMLASQQEADKKLQDARQYQRDMQEYARLKLLFEGKA